MIKDKGAPVFSVEGNKVTVTVGSVVAVYAYCNFHGLWKAE